MVFEGSIFLLGMGNLPNLENKLHGQQEGDNKVDHPPRLDLTGVHPFIVALSVLWLHVQVMPCAA